jgi:predicted small integral membrane protein
MTIEVIRHVLAWCTIINLGILLWWFLFYTLANEWVYSFHGKWFKLSKEQFDTIQYVGMAVYKIGIILFNIVPYITLRIVL